ncbi:MAG: cytochrome b/b6 domain-containing protein [Mariniphaga sp.]
MNQIPATDESSPFLQKHSALIRIWHWLTFIAITTLIITVLLASTALNPRENVKLVKEQLSQKGITVTDDQAFSVSHSYDDKMWDFHKLVGFVLAFLLFSRIIIEVVQPSDEKLMVRLKKSLNLNAATPEDQKLKKHYLTVKRGYFVFYILLLVIVLTGLGIAFGHDVAFLDHNHRLIMKIHSFCQYLMYGFVAVHLGGVIIADLTHSGGIVSGMINGNKK